MKRYLFFSLCTVCLAITSLSAQEPVILQGQVLNDTIEKASLTVVNINLQKGAITNQNGLFKIPVRVNDTINISAVQYEPREFVVTQRIYDRRTTELYLVPKITELDNVTISNIDLTGNLEKDVASTPLRPYISTVGFGPGGGKPIPTAEERRAMSGGGGGILGNLINAISGRAKLLQRHLEVANFQLKVERIRERFSDTLYMKALNIPEPLIEDFVFYALEDPKSVAYLKEDRLLELLEFFMEKSVVYRENKRKEAGIKSPPSEDGNKQRA